MDGLGECIRYMRICKMNMCCVSDDRIVEEVLCEDVYEDVSVCLSARKCFVFAWFGAN